MNERDVETLDIYYKIALCYLIYFHISLISSLLRKRAHSFQDLKTK